MAPTLLLLTLLVHIVAVVVVQSFHLKTSFQHHHHHHHHHHHYGLSLSLSNPSSSPIGAATTTLLVENPDLRFASGRREETTRRVAFPLFLSSPSQQDDGQDSDTTDEDGTIPDSLSTTTASSNSTTAAAKTTSMAKTVKKAARSLLVKLNDVGSSFKPKAEKATAKGYEATTKSAQFGYGLQACLYYSLFILYRAYRGLFVLLPAVFKQVYIQMDEAMKSSDMSLAEITEEEQLPDGGFVGEVDVYKPKTQMWRTRLTVSALAAVVTASYMIGGTVQMATRFFKTLTKSSSVTKSFEAAADGMVDYESKIGKIGGSGGGGGATTTTINGATPTYEDPDELTP